MKNMILAIAASGAALLAASAPAAAETSHSAERYAVPVAIDGIDLRTPAGRQAYMRRANAASFQACGHSQGRGATDDASNKLCRQSFLAAAEAEADKRVAPMMAANSDK